MNEGILSLSDRPVTMPIPFNNRTKSSVIMPVPIASPPELTPEHVGNLTLWLDASKRESFSFNGANISQWRDRRGINSVSQATAAQQPTYLPGGWRGNPAVWFRGSNVMTNTSWSMPTQNFTMAYVFVPTSQMTQYARLMTCVPNPISGNDYTTTTAWNFTIDTIGGGAILTNGDNSRLFTAGIFCSNSASAGGGRINAFQYGARRAYAVYVGAGTNLLGVKYSFFRVMGQAGFGLWNATAPSAGVSLGATWIGNSSYLPQSFIGYQLECAVWSKTLTEFEMVGLDKYFARKWQVDSTQIDGFFNPQDRLIPFRQTAGSISSLDGSSYNFTY